MTPYYKDNLITEIEKYLSDRTDIKYNDSARRFRAAIYFLDEHYKDLGLNEAVDIAKRAVRNAIRQGVYKRI